MNEVKRYGYLGIVQEEDGEVVKWEDYAALKAERDALAAENATIKTMNDVLSEELRGYESDGAHDGPIAHKLWHSISETPATDAYLNSVRAEGVEAFAHQQRVIADATPAAAFQRDRRFAAGLAEDFAAQLRAGEPS